MTTETRDARRKTPAKPKETQDARRQTPANAGFQAARQALCPPAQRGEGTAGRGTRPGVGGQLHDQVSLDAIRGLIASISDPELPFLSIADLGILRRVEVDGDRVLVTITPTYSGCPAMDAIRSDISAVLSTHGYHPEIRTQLSPAWITDDITPKGRRLLHEMGIAPPGSVDDVLCPRCAEPARMVSEFGSTACKALMVCASCREPFDLFKELK